MAEIKVINGAGRLADKLERLGAMGQQEIQKVVAVTTALAQEAIVDKITSGVYPHSGLSRKRNPQSTVTDLVDTGAYRQSWQIKVEPGKGTLYTNNEYALFLEYGTDDMKGFAVARDTARKMRRVFVKRMQDKIKDIVK